MEPVRVVDTNAAHDHGEPGAAERIRTRFDAFAALRPGEDTLETCLRALGAPVRVVEHRVDAGRRSGVALAYYWLDSSSWGVSVSPPRSSGVSYRFDSTGADLPGCVLWFDDQLVLERARAGMVGALLPRPRPPAPVLDGA